MPDAAFPALVSVLAISALSFVGALALTMGPVRLQRMLPFLVALAAGALIGDVLFHLLPEAVEMEGGFSGSVIWGTLAGLLGFFVVEGFLHWHHHGDDVHHHAAGNLPSLAWMNLLGDAIHNFIDGALVGGTWLVSPEAGLATTVAVALHEIPQEFGDFGVLLHAGLSPRKALLCNALTASAAILGAVLALVTGGLFGMERWLVPVAAGGFLYVACADLVPELRERVRGWRLLQASLALGAGIVLVTLVPALWSGGGHHHGPGPQPVHDHGQDGGHDHGHGHGPAHAQEHEGGPGNAE